MAGPEVQKMYAKRLPLFRQRDRRWQREKDETSRVPVRYVVSLQIIDAIAFFSLWKTNGGRCRYTGKEMHTYILPGRYLSYLASYPDILDPGPCWQDRSRVPLGEVIHTIHTYIQYISWSLDWPRDRGKIKIPSCMQIFLANNRAFLRSKSKSDNCLTSRVELISICSQLLSIYPSNGKLYQLMYLPGRD